MRTPHVKPSANSSARLLISRVIPASLLTALLISPVSHISTAQADFDAGMRAFESSYFDKARSEWSKSSTAGDAPSQYQLGMLFDKGTGVRENNTQAHFWYALAAIGGVEEASAALIEIEKEMTAEEIAAAKELTDRFVGVFAPVRYITVEPSNDEKVTTVETAPKEAIEEQPVSEEIAETPAAPVETVTTEAETDKTVVTEEAETVSEETAAVTEEAETVSEETAAVTEEAETVSEETAAVTEEAETVSEETAAVTEEAETVSEETVTVTEEAETVSEETVTVTEEAETVLQETITVTEDGVTVSEESQTVPEQTQPLAESAPDATPAPGTVESSDISTTLVDDSEKSQQGQTEPQPTQITAIQPSDSSLQPEQQETSETVTDNAEQLDEAKVEPVAKNTPVESRGVLPSSSSLDPNRQLREKMRTLIREVQTMLNDLGYPVGTADGVIGRKTREAVANFQRDNGLPNSGELGPQTIRALRARS